MRNISSSLHVRGMQVGGNFWKRAPLDCIQEFCTIKKRSRVSAAKAKKKTKNRFFLASSKNCTLRNAGRRSESLKNGIFYKARIPLRRDRGNRRDTGNTLGGMGGE